MSYSSYGHHIGGFRALLTEALSDNIMICLIEAWHDWLNRTARRSAHFEPNHKEYVRSAPYMMRRGHLRSTLQLSHAQSAEIVILTHERRWRTFSDLALKFSQRPILHEHVDGVVLWTAYGKN